MEGLKVISGSQSRLMEEFAILKGASSETFMENAGIAIAKHCADHEIVWLLCGKGNNAGDAYAAGVQLLQKGCSVHAYRLFPLEESSALCQKMHNRFVAAGGKVDLFVPKRGCFHEKRGVILDGLLGTGFKGKVESPLYAIIEEANRSCLPIFSIDIPSGLNADTGDVETVAIHASLTLCLGIPKVGFFLKQGKDYTGTVSYLDFGLPVEAMDSIKPLACLLDEKEVSQLLPQITPTRHKYEAGYVLAVAGSSRLKGAAALSSFAALRAGAGMVRLFYPSDAFLELPYEVVSCPIEGGNIKPLLKETARAKALLIGPGLGTSKEVHALVKKILKNVILPCVIDADALDPGVPFPKGSILTPHRGEALRLVPKGDFQRYVDENQITLVLKGAPTWIFHPKETPLICLRGSPGMATAGSGDVLTGIIAALLSQGLKPRQAAVLGAYLHGIAGEKAAEKLTPYCMVASDLFTYLPDAFFFCEKGIA